MSSLPTCHGVSGQPASPCHTLVCLEDDVHGANGPQLLGGDGATELPLELTVGVVAVVHLHIVVHAPRPTCQGHRGHRG